MALRKFEVGVAREERLPAILLIILFGMLCVAGGASREDVLAQSMIRGAAVLAMLVHLLLETGQ